MHDSILDDDVRAFRDSFRKFVEKEVTPFHAQWEKDGVVPRALWEKAGKQGFLCIGQAEEYGGSGLDFRFSAIVAEELARAMAHGPFFPLHSDIVCPYIEHYGSEEQKKKWLPKMAAGTCIGAIAMTEPGTGSDLQGIQTRAVEDGDHFVINGSKTFISNGILNDLCIVACRTDTDTDSPWQSISLIVVERDTPGYVRGRQLEKIGMHAQDTTELHFEDCRVPKTNLLGERGQGFIYLMNELARERMIVAVGSVAGAHAALEITTQYCKDRKAFGKPISKLQNTRFKIAEMATEVAVAEAFSDRCIQRLLKGENLTVEASMAKYWCSEMLCRVVDMGVQLHGGYGFMNEYPISRAYIDARVQRIYAGTTEIMKEIIARAFL